MKFFPSRDIVFITKLTEAQVAARIDALLWDGKYEGKIWEETFQMHRIIGYRNSFLPQIKGVIKKGENETIIKVNMQLHISVKIFSYIWAGGMLLFWIVAIWAAIATKEFSSSVVIPAGGIVFLFLMTNGAFAWESDTARIDLKKAFEAEIVK